MFAYSQAPWAHRLRIKLTEWKTKPFAGNVLVYFQESKPGPFSCLSWTCVWRPPVFLIVMRLSACWKRRISNKHFQGTVLKKMIRSARNLDKAWPTLDWIREREQQKYRWLTVKFGCFVLCFAGFNFLVDSRISPHRTKFHVDKVSASAWQVKTNMLCWNILVSLVTAGGNWFNEFLFVLFFVFVNNTSILSNLHSKLTMPLRRFVVRTPHDAPCTETDWAHTLSQKRVFCQAASCMLTHIWSAALIQNRKNTVWRYLQFQTFFMSESLKCEKSRQWRSCWMWRKLGLCSDATRAAVRRRWTASRTGWVCPGWSRRATTRFPSGGGPSGSSSSSGASVSPSTRSAARFCTTGANRSPWGCPWKPELRWSSLPWPSATSIRRGCRPSSHMAWRISPLSWGTQSHPRWTRKDAHSLLETTRRTNGAILVWIGSRCTGNWLTNWTTCCWRYVFSFFFVRTSA